MKRHTQVAGIREWAADDLLELQSEPLRALDAFFAQYGPCIIQGCELTPDGQGGYNFSPGLVALEVMEEEGTTVKVMPFAGDAHLQLPFHLTAVTNTVTDLYSDGYEKPIAYQYEALAVQQEPAELPSLLITGEGGHFVDVLQDPEHRFITDQERAVWDAVLDKAMEYADLREEAFRNYVEAELDALRADAQALEATLRDEMQQGGEESLQQAKDYIDDREGEIRSDMDTSLEANLRTARNYTDQRETILRANYAEDDRIVLDTAKDYADRVVEALVDGSPEALNTLKELADALGNDPNFATTVMTEIGKRVKTEDFTTELAKKLNLGGGTMSGALTIKNQYGQAVLWIDDAGLYINNQNTSGNTVSQIRIRLNGTVTFWESGTNTFHTLWHSGNFNPAGKLDTSGGTLTGLLRQRGSEDAGENWIGRDRHGMYLSNYNAAGVQTAQLRLRNEGTASFYSEMTKETGTLWHSANFNPASKLDTTANAVSASKLQTARTINGAAFDGTAPVTFGTLYPVEIKNDDNLTDLNDFTQPGMYYCPMSSTAATLLNTPTVLAFSLLVERTTVEGWKQTLSEYTPESSKTYVRYHYRGTWGAWGRVYTTIDAPPAPNLTNYWHSGNFNPASKLDTTANAVSATKLQTARTINGAAFDGTAPVTFGTLYPVEIANYTDLNTIQQPGMYCCVTSTAAATLKNSPTVYAFSLLVERHAGVKQTLTEHMPASAKTYFRMFFNGAWGSWQRVYTTLDPPPVPGLQVICHGEINSTGWLRWSAGASYLSTSMNGKDYVIKHSANTIQYTVNILPIIEPGESNNIVTPHIESKSENILQISMRKSGSNEKVNQAFLITIFK